jgi:hypothetical protein
MAAMNKTTAAKGAIKAKRSCRLGVCWAHQLSHIAARGLNNDAVDGFDMCVEFMSAKYPYRRNYKIS